MCEIGKVSALEFVQSRVSLDGFGIKSCLQTPTADLKPDWEE